MIIKIPDSWLREYLETDASYAEIAEWLTLCGPTVEAVEKLKDDFVYTIELTPNRVDLASVIGIAREAAAIIPRFNKNAELKNLPSPEITSGKQPKQNLSLNFQVTEDSLCPYSIIQVVDKAQIKPSPTFIRERLEKSGMRGINNVVDISNYVMLETGQPLHIFDYDKITGYSMNLRESKKGEKLTTLDDTEHEIPEGSIVIEDAEKLIDLCGIMGGVNSEVSEDTTRLVIFVQHYDPTKIRKTFRKLNLVTEAALRFEKGIDPSAIPMAFNRTRDLLGKHAQTRVASGVIQKGSFEYESREVSVEMSLVQEYLDDRIEREEAVRHLESLGFSVKVEESSFTSPKLKVRVPSWRAEDILIPEDLIEEIARMYGYHNISEKLPNSPPPDRLIDDKYFWEQIIEDTLSSNGFTESYNYSFTSIENIEKLLLSTKTAVKVTNPLNTDLSYLRPSLFCSLLENVKANVNNTQESAFYEHERVYTPTNNLPDENFQISGVSFKTEFDKDHFYAVKSTLENVFDNLHVRHEFTPAKQLGIIWREGMCADIKLDGKRVGKVGYLKPKILDNYGIEGDLVAFELDAKLLTHAATKIINLQPILDHPPVVEDISLIVSRDVTSAEIEMEIKKVIGDYKDLDLKASTIELTDLFDEERRVGKGRKSLTYRIYYQNELATPNTSIVEEVRTALIAHLEKKLHAEVRTAEAP